MSKSGRNLHWDREGRAQLGEGISLASARALAGTIMEKHLFVGGCLGRQQFPAFCLSGLQAVFQIAQEV
jgi:hypothetical protein